MDSLITVFSEFIRTPGLPLQVGIMIAFAIMLGYILYADYRDLIKWGVTAVGFVAFEEWMRAAFLKSIGQTVTMRPLFLAVVFGTIYGIGLVIGIVVSYRVGATHENSGNTTPLVRDIIRRYTEKKE